MIGSPRRALGPLVRNLARLGMVGAVALAGAELGARLDDWVFLGVPPLSSPTYDSELRLQDAGFMRGRPHGRFKRWQLDEHGFNGPPTPLEPRADCVRVIVLGASETFGSFESPGRELVTQLRDRLAGEPCFEVINASIVGMSTASATAYWKGWVERFRPDVALIYPNPLLSLRISDDSDRHCAPRPPASDGAAPAAAPNGYRPRFLDRLRDALDTPQWLANAQVERNLARLVRERGPHWLLDSVPPQCLEGFRAELLELVGAVQASGALPVVCTHALSILSEREGARSGLWMRQWVPRVPAPAQIRYHDEANDAVRSLAGRPSVAVFDVDAALRGCDECFVDPVHFTDAGAERLASALAAFLVRLSQPGEHALQ